MVFRLSSRICVFMAESRRHIDNNFRPPTDDPPCDHLRFFCFGELAIWSWRRLEAFIIWSMRTTINTQTHKQERWGAGKQYRLKTVDGCDRQTTAAALAATSVPIKTHWYFWQATISNPAWTKISSEINYISSHLINQTQKYKHLDLTTKNKTHNTIIRTLGPVKEEEEIPRVLNKDTTLEVSWGRCLTSKSGPIVVKPLASQRGSLLFLILQLDSDWNIFRPLPQSKIAS